MVEDSQLTIGQALKALWRQTSLEAAANLLRVDPAAVANCAALDPTLAQHRTQLNHLDYIYHITASPPAAIPVAPTDFHERPTSDHALAAHRPQ